MNLALIRKPWWRTVPAAIVACVSRIRERMQQRRENVRLWGELYDYDE